MKQLNIVLVFLQNWHSMLRGPARPPSKQDWRVSISPSGCTGICGNSSGDSSSGSSPRILDLAAEQLVRKSSTVAAPVLLLQLVAWSYACQSQGSTPWLDDVASGSGPTGRAVTEPLGFTLSLLLPQTVHRVVLIWEVVCRWYTCPRELAI
eukprot:4094257-Amphidinium_carterae.2